MKNTEIASEGSAAIPSCNIALYPSVAHHHEEYVPSDAE